MGDGAMGAYSSVPCAGRERRGWQMIPHCHCLIVCSAMTAAQLTNRMREGDRRKERERGDRLPDKRLMSATAATIIPLLGWLTDCTRIETTWHGTHCRWQTIMSDC